MVIQILTYCILWFLFQAAFSQNLVKNYSFERDSAVTADRRVHCNYWMSISDCTVRYDTTWDSQPFPHSGMELIHPKEGNAYMDILILDNYGNMGHLQGRFKKPLKQGQKYKIEYYVRNPNNQRFSWVWNFGFQFSKHPYVWSLGGFREINPYNKYDSTETKYDRFHPYNYVNTLYIDKITVDVRNDSGNWITEDDRWTKIEGEYVAEGGEKYLTFGMFYIDSEKLNNQLFNQIIHHAYDDNGIPYFNKNLLYDPRDNKKYAPKGGSLYLDVVKMYPVDSTGNKMILYPELVEEDKEKPD